MVRGSSNLETLSRMNFKIRLSASLPRRVRVLSASGVNSIFQFKAVLQFF